MNDENLKPFKKGDDPRRNLDGRPKLPDLREVMAEILGEEKDKKTGIKRIIDKLQELAEGGNIKAAQVLLERGYGLSRIQVDHTTKGEAINQQIIINPVAAVPLAKSENEVDAKPNVPEPPAQ